MRRNLRAGQKYIVYASGPPRYPRVLCSRTRLLAEAGEDPPISATRPGASAVVDGTVRVDADDDRQGSPRANVTIRARGTQSIARTDAHGRFHLELPVKLHAGRGRPGAAHPARPAADARLPDAGACARRDIVVVWNGRIRGTLPDHTGRPPTSRSPPMRGVRRGRSGGLMPAPMPPGRYEIPEVPPGTQMSPSASPKTAAPDERQPIPPTYSSRHRGARQGQTAHHYARWLAERIDFRLPAAGGAYDTRCRAPRWQAGRQVNVRLENQTRLRSTGVETDSTGGYTLKRGRRLCLGRRCAWMA